MEQKSVKRTWIVEAVILAIGLFFLGSRIEAGLVAAGSNDRTVAVRGLAERIVPADKVVWPLVYKEVGNDIATLAATVEQKNKVIIDYLVSKGIPREEISVASPEIYDLKAERYSTQDVPYRYNVRSIITVSSQKIDLVLELLSQQGELLDKGVAIVSGDYDARVNFLFTGLNDLKPEMIAEATRNARAAAEQFANDSESRLGKIRSASQGQFSIEDRDDYTPQYKKVRVVTSVVYYLKD